MNGASDACDRPAICEHKHVWPSMLRWLTGWRRRRILRRHRIDDGAWQEAMAHVAAARRLGAEDRARLRELATMFLHDKKIEGAKGFEVTGVMGLVIAIQACLLVLNLGLEWYAGWQSIVVYQDQFRPHEEYEDELGIVHVDHAARAGEAWLHGPVVLSWADVLEGTKSINDGYNLVVHEFAHKLDGRSGEENGQPPLHEDMDAGRWRDVWSSAYAGFCAQVDRGEETFIDPYAAESPAEFFAVLSEVFFELPVELRQWNQALYVQMTRFYRQDPAAMMASGG